MEHVEGRGAGTLEGGEKLRWGHAMPMPENGGHRLELGPRILARRNPAQIPAPATVIPAMRVPGWCRNEPQRAGFRHLSAGIPARNPALSASSGTFLCGKNQ